MKKRIILLNSEVLDIAEKLMTSSKEDDHGVFWETLHRQPYGELYNQVNEEIYNGVSGISLFFVFLYNYTHDLRHLKTAQRSISWIMHFVKIHPKEHYTFYTGLTGVVYLNIKMFEATGNDFYLQSASGLIKELEDGIKSKVILDDLLSGNAGNLLVITSLYTHTHDPQHLQLVKFLIDKLVGNARISKEGIKWGYKNNAIDSFTGMSHGASGIAHVLIEVAKALDYKELNWMAEKAFAFEDQYYSKHLSSWIDMRISAHHKTDPEILNAGAKFYYNDKKDVNAWAHGIAGMGLARLNAYQSLNKKEFKKGSLRAIIRTLADVESEQSFSNFTLSTGLGSWIELLLTASEILNNPVLKQKAITLALKAIGSKNRNGFYGSGWYINKEDPALLVGTAGIGYMFLKILYANTASILIPPICKQAKNGLNEKHSLTAVRKNIYGKYLKRTTWLLEDLKYKTDILFRTDPNKNELNQICQNFIIEINGLQEIKKKIVKEAFKMELASIRLATNPDINLYREQRFDNFKQNMIDAERLNKEAFSTLTIKLSKHVKLINNRWNWPLNDKIICIINLNKTPDFFPVILRLEINKIEEFQLNKFSFLILNCLKNPTTLSDLMEVIRSKVAVEDKELLELKVIEQLKLFIKQWFIEIY